MLDLGYAAGIFDGEGCITFLMGASGKLKVQVSVKMTNESIPRAFHEQFGGNVYVREYPAGANRKTCYDWKATSLSDSIAFLAQIYPYLVVKKEQATLALLYFQNKASLSQEELEKIKQKIHGYNRRGTFKIGA